MVANRDFVGKRDQGFHGGFCCRREIGVSWPNLAEEVVKSTDVVGHVDHAGKSTMTVVGASMRSSSRISCGVGHWV